MDKTTTDGILKILITDLTEIPYDRLEPLARKIGRFVSGASMVPLLGAEYVSQLKQAEALDEQAEAEALAGNYGAALRLMIQSLDLSLESSRAVIA